MDDISERKDVFVREFLRKDGIILNISQYETGDVGCVVWDAAIVLSYYLESQDFTTSNGESLLKGKRVVELGAGTGIVGIQAAVSGAYCILTDLQECLPLMQINIQSNIKTIKGKIECRTILWGSDVSDFLPPPDYLVLADCIYYEESLNPLVKTMSELCDDNTVILCCYESRSTGNKPQLEKQFFELIEREFVKEIVPLSRQDPIYSCEEICIMKLTKKQDNLK